MMQVLLEVLKDLWNFAFASIGKSFSGKVTSNNGSEIVSTPRPVSADVPIKSIEESIEERIASIQPEGQVAYVQKDTVICFSKPEISFDTKLGELLYGDTVTVMRIKDSFAQITTRTLSGWVESESLTEDLHLVLPEFRAAYLYDASNDQAVKLRQYIRDESLGSNLGLPLQSAEFALYTLKRNRAKVVWPNERPRLPGSWKTLLRGVKGVSMSIEPRTGSIFEYAGDDDVPGFLGFVESVHPDMSITLQSIGRLLEGEYRSEEFAQSEWKEWRPVFISVT